MGKQNRDDNKKEESLKTRLLAFIDSIPVRSCMVWCLAGIYLLYTGYSLCKNVLTGVEGGGIGFLLVGIAFLLIGAGMLTVGVRGVVRDNKRQKEEAAAYEAEEQKAALEQTKKISSEETDEVSEEETDVSEEE